jgi:hypothetical protein
MAFSGVARVGRMTEWPDWIPTPEIQARLGPYPARVPGGPANPLGARALYLYEGNKDTLYRIHGTNQPEYIGQAISSGCIRMTNEDVIDLFDRVKQGATVVLAADQLVVGRLCDFRPKLTWAIGAKPTPTFGQKPGLRPKRRHSLALESVFGCAISYFAAREGALPGELTWVRSRSRDSNRPAAPDDRLTSSR